jgi:hypothetical protein
MRRGEPIPADVASIHSRADVAQLVEHFTRNEGVGSSSLPVGLGQKRMDAGVWGRLGPGLPRFKSAPIGPFLLPPVANW